MKYAISLVLSVLFPGMAQIYAKKYIRAFIFPAAFLFLVLIAKYTILSEFTGFVILLSLELLLRLIALVDGVLLLRKSAPQTRWYLVVVVFILAISLNFILPIDLSSKFGYYPTYSATIENMRETLFKGDHIVASFKPEDIRDLKRNDIVVFEGDGNLRISRVVALGNDEIGMDSGKLHINGAAAEQSFAYMDDPKGIEIKTEEKSNPNSPLVKLFQTIETTRLDENAVYLIGDNRFNSKDSRFFGPIERDSVVAKVLYMTFSDDFSRIGVKLK